MKEPRLPQICSATVPSARVAVPTVGAAFTRRAPSRSAYGLAGRICGAPPPLSFKPSMHPGRPGYRAANRRPARTLSHGQPKAAQKTRLG